MRAGTAYLHSACTQLLIRFVARQVTPGQIGLRDR